MNCRPASPSFLGHTLNWQAGLRLQAAAVHLHACSVFVTLPSLAQLTGPSTGESHLVRGGGEGPGQRKHWVGRAADRAWRRILIWAPCQ
jgi:hypothetical protein